jgi:hypothetical protein
VRNTACSSHDREDNECIVALIIERTLRTNAVHMVVIWSDKKRKEKEDTTCSSLDPEDPACSSHDREDTACSSHAREYTPCSSYDREDTVCSSHDLQLQHGR